MWERGFGVVFPELEGVDAFAAVADTIDLIEALAPVTVIPGHGPAFGNVGASIASARARLDSFVTDPDKHITYAAKVLLKFKLLEAQTLGLDEFIAWAHATPYFMLIFSRYFAGMDFSQWVEHLIGELVRAGAATSVGRMIRNAG